MANPHDIIQVIRNVPYFASLDDSDLTEISRSMIRRKYAVGQVIFHMDDPGGLLYIILEGKVKVYRTNAEGNEAVLAILGIGEFFGELSLIDNEPRSATAEAIEDAQVYTLHRDDFLRFLKNNPAFSIQISSVLAQRIRSMNEQVSDVLFLDLPGRLARKLIQLAQNHGEEKEDGSIYIPISLTQSNLAEMTGATRVSVNKALKVFRDAGWVTVTNRKITINDMDALSNRIMISGG